VRGPDRLAPTLSTRGRCLASLFRLKTTLGNTHLTHSLHHVQGKARPLRAVPPTRTRECPQVVLGVEREREEGASAALHARPGVAPRDAAPSRASKLGPQRALGSGHALFGYAPEGSTRPNASRKRAARCRLRCQETVAAGRPPRLPPVCPAVGRAPRQAAARRPHGETLVLEQLKAIRQSLNAGPPGAS